MSITEDEPASARTMLKCAWRISREKRFKTIEKLMAATMQIRWAFHLSEAEHRACCERALRMGEHALAVTLFMKETNYGRS